LLSTSSDVNNPLKYTSNNRGLLFRVVLVPETMRCNCLSFG